MAFFGFIPQNWLEAIINTFSRRKCAGEILEHDLKYWLKFENNLFFSIYVNEFRVHRINRCMGCKTINSLSEHSFFICSGWNSFHVRINALMGCESTSKLSWNIQQQSEIEMLIISNVLYEMIIANNHYATVLSSIFWFVYVHIKKCPQHTHSDSFAYWSTDLNFNAHLIRFFTKYFPQTITSSNLTHCSTILRHFKSMFWLASVLFTPIYFDYDFSNSRKDTAVKPKLGTMKTNIPMI